MTTATLIDPIARYRLLHSLGLRPGQLTPARALIAAGQRARAQGLAEAYWNVILPKERQYIAEFAERPNAVTPWLYIDGISPHAYEPQTTVYTPPVVWRETRTVINPLRLRGGLVTVVKPTVLLLPAPRIAALLPAVCPTNHQQAALDYWQALAVLEGTRYRTSET